MPGIEGVAAVSGLPPQREINGFGTDIENYTPPPERSELVGYYQTVTSGYFEAMRIPIVQGRAFQAADRTGAPVAVVNEAFVRTFWKDIDPIGRRVRPRFGDQTPWVTVIGVAKDVKQAGVDRPTGTELYFLLDQLPRVFPTIPGARLGNRLGDGSMHIMLRSAVPAATLQPSIANAVREADPVAADHPVAQHGGCLPRFGAPAPHADAAPGGVRRSRAPAGGDRHLRCAVVHGHPAAT